ncbi:MAG: TlpA family protein disulfide reductase [Bdellovibrionia bacterium]
MKTFIVCFLLTVATPALALTEKGAQPFKLLDFWASWCTPCEKSFPEIEKLHQKYSQQVEFIGVNQDTDLKDMEEFLKKNPVSFRHQQDTGKKLLKQYEIKALPTTVLISADGKEIFRLRGYRDQDHLKIEKAIIDALDQHKQNQEPQIQK